MSEKPREGVDARAVMIGGVIVACAGTVTGALMVAAILPGGYVVGGCGLAGSALLYASLLKLTRKAGGQS